jgi:hypothetical protein
MHEAHPEPLLAQAGTTATRNEPGSPNATTEFVHHCAEGVA